MTEREGAEEQERGEARRRQRAAIQAQEANEEEFWVNQMGAESHQRESQRATAEMTRTPLSPLFCIIYRDGSHHLHQYQYKLFYTTYFNSYQTSRESKPAFRPDSNTFS
jgi:hypothetical protein